MKVEDFMTSGVFSVQLDFKVRDAIELLTTKKISGAPVVDRSGCVVSVISEGDVLKLAAAGKLNETIANCLAQLTATKDIVILKRTATFVDAYRMFLTNSVHRLVVTDSGGKLQGIVSRSNILRMLIEGSQSESVSQSETSKSA